jgi:hypothetical protein
MNYDELPNLKKSGNERVLSFYSIYYIYERSKKMEIAFNMLLILYID